MATEDNRTRIIVAIISGVFLLASTLIGGYSIGQNNANQTNDSKNEQLSSEYEKLSLDHKELRRAYEDLQQKYNRLLSENEVLQKEISLLKNKQTSEEETNDDTTPKVNNENSEPLTHAMMQVCKPYQVTFDNGYKESNNISMSGQTHGSGFTIRSPGPPEEYYLLFNLGGKYSLMEFDLGHIDEGSMHNGIFVIYIDDKYITTIEKSAKSMVSKESIELNYGNQLRIEYETGVAGYFSWYGFANILLYE